MRHLPELDPGTRVGPYVIGEALGRGGVAVVYRVQRAEGRGQADLAMKVAFQANSQRDKRFIREFERLRVIAIPGVARVYEAGSTDELLWYVMDAVPGAKMDRRIAVGETTAERVQLAMETGARLMDVLAGIHRLGFIHRDIKPSNVMVDEALNLHVLDFGLVRLTERGDTLTRAGRLVGTVAFMSPEQTTGIALTFASDIFSAGLVLYEGIGGPRKRPHKQEEWLGRMCLQRVVPLCIRDPAVPRGISHLVDRMLSLDPHERPTAEACAEVFRELQHGRGTPDWPDPPKFVGRENELTALMQAFEPSSAPLQILQGPAGSGRRRLLEQVQRRALLYGTSRISGRCTPEVAGGAILSALNQLLLTHSDADWRARVTGPDAAELLAMWPTLPLTAPVLTDTAPTLQSIASAVARTLKRAVDSAGLMVVFEDLDQVDSLTARVIQAMVSHPAERLAIFATLDGRWASDRAIRLARSLTGHGTALVHDLQDLSGAEASALASSLVSDRIGLTVSSSSAQRAREAGLDRLSGRMGSAFATVPAQALPLALTERALPGAVLAELQIDPDPLVAQGTLVQDARGLYSISGGALRRSALAMMPDRRSAEDRLADAITRGGMGSERWRDVARHRLRGARPAKALGPAIQAAVHAVRTGQFQEARAWLMSIDPLPRDRTDPTYQSLRFELSWCRAQTSLATDMSRTREDLLSQAAERAQGEQDEARVTALRVQMLTRRRHTEEALSRCQTAIDHPWIAGEAQSALFSLQAARICLNVGHSDAARAHLGGAASCAKLPEHGLARADLAALDGDVQSMLLICRSGIAQAHTPEQAGARARLSLRLGSALVHAGDRPGATHAILSATRVLRGLGHRTDTAEANIRAADLALGRGHATTAGIWLDPVLAITESFGLQRLQAELCRLRLEIATAQDDAPGASRAMSAWQPEYRGPVAGWRHALVRWYWSQKDIDRALEVAQVDFSPSAAGTHLAIDHAHLLLHTGDRPGASRLLSQAMDHAESQGLEDLSLMADLLAGAIAPEEDDSWAQTVRAARASPWMELSLMSLAISGQRELSRGEPGRAREIFTVLHDRAHHLDDNMKTQLANLGMRRC
jgi:hypothetical protein